MTYSLQRRLSGDSRKWRTVQTFDLAEAVDALESAIRLGNIGEPIEWRVCSGPYPLLYWTRERGWITLEGDFRVEIPCLDSGGTPRRSRRADQARAHLS